MKLLLETTSLWGTVFRCGALSFLMPIYKVVLPESVPGFPGGDIHKRRVALNDPDPHHCVLSPTQCERLPVVPVITTRGHHRTPGDFSRRSQG